MRLIISPADLIELFLHLDEKLSAAIAAYGAWTYLILFLVIFCETGLVIMPFLPGDSLLFAAGALAASGSLEIELLVLSLVAAAIAGDTVNYWIGYRSGKRILAMKGGRLVKREHLERTHRFYEKHGGKTIVLARFVPIVRTIAPFVAGIGEMSYPRFLAYNVFGGILWICAFVLGGYFFGAIPAVKGNFSLVIVGIIAVSVAPAAVDLIRKRLGGRS